VQDIERPPVLSEDSSGQTELTENPLETVETTSEPQSEEVVYPKISPDEISSSQDLNVEDVEKAINRELRYDEDIDEKIKNPGILGRFKFYEDEIYDDELFEEPELKDAMRRLNIAATSITLRSAPAVIIAIFMLVLTLAYEAGWVIPFGIGRVQSTAVAVLLIGLLVIMMLCVDIVVRGAVFMMRGRPNVETLILFSCVFSIFSGIFSILRDSPGVMTYAAVSAFSLAIAAVGEKYNLRAMTETLKTAAIVSEPFGLLTDYNSEIDKSVLKKVSNRTDGFYNNLMHPDVVETAYRFTAPLLLAGSLILAAVTALARGHGEYFIYILNALLAAAAPFSAILAFAIPFRVISKSVRKSGTAISGWGGADEMCFTDGACVTDEDLFPPGTLSFSSTKLYDHVPSEKAIAYAASLVITSGSGVSGIFAEALKQHRLKVLKVEDFNCYEGGIGGRIHGEQVAAGSAAFMNLLGIRIPDELNMKNAVYTSVNNKLAAIFVIDYLPLKSVQGALRSILKWKIKLFFAMRDFNVTPLMLEQKFKISLKDVEFLQARESYDISEQKADKSGRMAAVLNREGLAPFAEAVTGGKLLKTTSLISTAISIFSAVLGVLIMTYLFWMGAFVSANPGNLLLFMLAMLGIVLAVCGYSKFGK
jgi:cation transport ATPase